MDAEYSAIFSKWIRDERNLPGAVSHYVRVANQYSLEQIILSLQWLIAEWKLKSIIQIVAAVTHGWDNEQDLGTLVKALAERWKPGYAAELIAAVIERWDARHCRLHEHDETAMAKRREMRLKKEHFFKTLMRGWQFSHIANVMLKLDTKVEWEVKASLFKWHHQTESMEQPLEQTVSTRDLHRRKPAVDTPLRNLLRIDVSNVDDITDSDSPLSARKKSLEWRQDAAADSDGQPSQSINSPSLTSDHSLTTIREE